MLKQVLTILGGIICLTLIINCTGTSRQYTTLDSTSSSPTSDSSSFQKTEMNYTYSEKIDEIKLASIRSENTIELNFPYGECGLTYCIRKNANGENDVYLIISSGQFTGNTYDGSNYITVRFDDLPPTKYTYSEAADGSFNVIFINNTKDFISKAKKATKIKIEVTLFEEGNRLFRFSTSEPLVWE